MRRPGLVCIGALAACGRIGFDPSLDVVPAYPAAPAWNDWVRNTAPDQPAWAQPGAACDGNEAGVEACLHGGELRRVITGFSSCAGLEISDALGALQWTCVEDSSGVTLFSTGLRPGMGLRHLVDADGWRRDSVEVRRDGEIIARSVPAVWWTNPVVPAPVSSDSVMLTTPGEIDVIATTTTTGGFVLGADRVSFVVLPGAILSPASTFPTNCDEGAGPGSSVTCVVAVGPQHFPWVEGDFDVRDTANYAVMLARTSFAHLRGIRASTATVNDIALFSASSSSIVDAVLVDAANYGLGVFGGGDNVITAVTVAGNGRNGNPGTTGLYFDSSSGNVITRVLAADNVPYGVLFYSGSRGNTLAHATLASNAFEGVQVGETGNVVAQVVMVNQPNAPGLELLVANRGALLIAANNSVGVQTDVEPPGLSGPLLLGSNALEDCNIWQAAAHVADCAPLGPSANVQLGIDLTTALRARVTTDDDANASDHAGAATRAEITDWLHFESPSRVWGADGGWPGTADLCRDSCRIWDWRRTPGDTLLVAHDRSGAASDEPFVTGAPCPPRLDGDHATMDAAGRYFLLQAIELIGDGRGNDDGLCQSGETCLDLRTAGAQRDDITSWTATGCTFHDGLVTGVDVRGAL